MGMTYSEYASFHPISRKDFIKQFSECQCKYCGEPLPKWFSKEKSKMDKFVQDMNKRDIINPHYNYEEFIWENDNEAYKDASDLY